MYSPLFVTLMGMGVVFVGLIVIIFLVMAMGAVLKSNAAPAPAAKAPVAPAAPAAPKVNTAQEQAVIAAIIAAVTEDLGPSASRMQITNITKI